MKVEESREGFDYYAIQIPVGSEPIHYYFEIRAGKIVCYYNELGVTRQLQEQYSFGIIRDSIHRTGQRGGNVPDFCGSFL